MEQTLEHTTPPSPVVDRVFQRVSSMYEKYAQVPVSFEIVKSFDRVAKTFQSEKGKKAVESIKPYIKTVANIGEGVNATLDVLCGAIGVGFGVKDMVSPKTIQKKAGLTGSMMSQSLSDKNISFGLAKVLLSPPAFLIGRPFSRGAQLGARVIGSIGEQVAKKVDQILLRKQISV